MMLDFKTILNGLKEIFHPKPKEANVSVTLGPTMAETTKPVGVTLTGNIVSTNHTYIAIESKSVKWRVPEDTTSVIVQVCESNGRLINEYTISNFITLRPGQILRVLAK